MSALVTINFGGGSAMTNLVLIEVGQGEIALQQPDGLTALISSGVTNIGAGSQTVTFATGLKAEFVGTLAVVIQWTPPQEPSITLNNLANGIESPATVSWPTATVPQTQQLTPGQPLTLSGIVSD